MSTVSSYRLRQARMLRGRLGVGYISTSTLWIVRTSTGRFSSPASADLATSWPGATKDRKEGCKGPYMDLSGRSIITSIFGRGSRDLAMVP